MQKIDSQFDLHVHSIRKQLCDTDGISAKYALDAIAREPGTILIDDSPKYIRKVTFSQEKGIPEKTIFRFSEVINESVQ